MNGQGTQQYFVAGINLGGFASSPAVIQQKPTSPSAVRRSLHFDPTRSGFAKGDAVFGYSNNFALGTLELSDLSTTVLMDSFGTVAPDDGKVVTGAT